jgi:predicted chitinase
MFSITAEQLQCVFPQLNSSAASTFAGIMTSLMGSPLGTSNSCQWAAMLGNIGTESDGLTEWTQLPCDSTDDAPYCGRGPLQITGQSNYNFCATNQYCSNCQSIVSQPSVVSTNPSVGFATAACVWGSLSGRNLNSLVDGSQNGFEETAEYINCGHLGCTPNGWTSRLAYYNTAQTCLA